MPASKDPTLASANARLMSMKRHHPTADTTELERTVKAARLAAFIRRTVAEFPPLTPEQKSELALLLRGSGRAERTDAA